VLRSRSAVVLSPVDPETLAGTVDDRQRAYLARNPVSALLIVPMRSRGRVVGTLWLTRAAGAPPLHRDDQIVLQEVGDRAAMHLDKARAFEAERKARRAAEAAADRTARLQMVTAELASANSSHDVSTVLMKHGRAAVGAVAAMLYQVDRERNAAVLARADGYDADKTALFAHVPLDADLPLCEAFRTGRALFFGSFDEMCERYPSLRGQQPRITRAAALVPLSIEGRVFGGVVFSFGEDRAIPRAEQFFLEGLVHQCALAFERARLAEAEHRARENAAFLAEASRLLTSTLDSETILHRLAELSVPRLGDWCAIEMQEGETTRQIAVFHRDPDKLGRAHELRRRLPPDPTGPRGVLQVMRSGVPELYRDFNEEMVQRSSTDEEVRALLRSFGLRSAMLVPLVIKGQVVGALTYAWAETDRRYGQGDLELAREVADRAALAVENARLYQEIKTAVQVRDDFLAVAGHELRTPLSALLMQVQSVERLVRKNPGTARLADRLHRAAESGLKLDRLVGQLLDVSRITGGRLRLEPEAVELGELVAEIVARFAEASSLAGCEVRFEWAANVRGQWDRMRVDQVVSNLLSNAFKYGRGKPVEVEVRCDDGMASVRVTDHGIGIDEKQQARIFDRFERAVASRDFGGLGLGLWIARQIVEASGGSIAVDSRPNEGATFLVRLPAGRAGEGGKAA
jgi:signal transduction histidine kinase